MVFSVIKDRLSIRDLIEPVTPVNNRGWARCPFHDDKTPSLKIDEEKGLFYCFGCGVGGDHFSFVEKLYGVSRGEALKILAAKASVSLDRTSPSPGVNQEIRETQERRQRREIFELWREITWRNHLTIYRVLNRLCRMLKPEGFAEDAWLDILGPLYQQITLTEAGLEIFEAGSLSDQFKYFMEQTR